MGSSSQHQGVQKEPCQYYYCLPNGHANNQTQRGDFGDVNLKILRSRASEICPCFQILRICGLLVSSGRRCCSLFTEWRLRSFRWFTLVENTRQWRSLVPPAMALISSFIDKSMHHWISESPLSWCFVCLSSLPSCVPCLL
ncbi:PREDICTED: uncharacterized protein LOC104713821 [Camelina sativa]|uniref:Uncharacterized protein LOC104713821 n=1 Tax=Camelina sativa TaxID=90675 RepID=A0ABM0TPI2_CAMSA|nr:PREDICTED: uncharacterized protein LOC104713821 [Camelina sativa]